MAIKLPQIEDSSLIISRQKASFNVSVMKNIMKKWCVRGSYVKRKSNIISGTKGKRINV